MSLLSPEEVVTHPWTKTEKYLTTPITADAAKQLDEANEKHLADPPVYKFDQVLSL